MDNALRQKMEAFQRTEITEHIFYSRLAARTKDPENRGVLERIAGDELKHYNFWKNLTGQDAKPDRLRLFWYGLLGRIFGLTFASKLMERGEKNSESSYLGMKGLVTNIDHIIADESRHEMELLRMLKEKRLTYVSSIVLGLNDALVELTGALAGLTFALADAELVAVSGFITGIAAAFSMGASEYLSNKASGVARREAVRAAIYTWIAYIVVVLLLIAPYFLMPSVIGALIVALVIGLIIIATFSYYISVVQETSFATHAGEMAALSLGVAALSFAVGIAARNLLGINI